ncbi:MAG: helix-turn-helix domain-containing protein [Betaproteobacteria bacterium]|nr:helix-turn-helix domain-containing protein [Betaproteobacteria bacterium]
MMPAEIRNLRKALGLTQQSLAALLGVSFATLNRWENGQVHPSRLALGKLQALQKNGAPPSTDPPLKIIEAARSETRLDFMGDANRLRVLVEGERLSYGHLFNPAFGAEISEIDPLPHQRIAVYERMLPQPRLRFLLADDAGAGKTIMTGLYVRESLSRRTIRRVLIVPPAGLVGNWARELRKLFQLRFRIATSADARRANPFAGPDSDLVIASVDSLRADTLFKALGEPSVPPYDLVVFDEAHKLSANRDSDGTFRPTDRYRLAEALAGVRDTPEDWRLPWSAHHLLLLTATPHMGKEYPYYCLWRLLEPDLFSTETAFKLFPADARPRYFMRRVKEEMVDLRGQPLYPVRICDTHSYDLSQGPVSEQTLYDETTKYIRHYYNQARLLNRSAARFAMTVFQRRLASSTWALLCSFRRRHERLDALIDDIQSGRIPEEQLRERQRKLDRQLRDALNDKSADEESTEGGIEEHEKDEAEALGAFIATTCAELIDERGRVRELIRLAERVNDRSQESKFEKMRELLRDPRFADQKIIIYTEHRDTLEFLVRRLEAMGHAGQVAFIHGGLDYQQRDAQVERFRRPHESSGAEAGARFFVGTDAAAEGINLQFCWVLVNYDVPWNPARLEQRMGRIHRYGQKKDRVVVLNLVAGRTREGRVVKTLLDKLEDIRVALGSDKVFDVIGRVFEDFPLTDYLQKAILSDDAADREAIELAGQLTIEQVRAIAAREEAIYGKGGEVVAQLARLKEALNIEEMRRLLPGYVRRYLEHAAPEIGVDLIGDLDSEFFLRARTRGALDGVLPLIESYPDSARSRLTVYRPDDKRDAIFLHPGEPVFDRLSVLAIERCRSAGRQGAVFTDPSATQPYLFHVARVSVVRSADHDFASLHRDEVMDERLIGIRQFADNRMVEAPVEQLLLLKPGTKVDPAAVPFLAQGDAYREAAYQYARDALLAQLCELQTLSARSRLEQTEAYLRRAYDYQESELASARKRYTDRSRGGDKKADEELDRIKLQQRGLSDRRELAIAQARREVELIGSGRVEIIATALVQPSNAIEDIKARDAQVERIAMELAIAHEASLGADVRDVSTPEKARVVGLSDYPGFDLHSKRPDGKIRMIEVKGRTGATHIELLENEWARACILREKYWLYAAFDCDSATPRLFRVQDPFATLLAKARGSVVVNYGDIARSATE